MFITFTKEYEHYIDNIKNGFLMKEHSIQFLPSTHDLVTSLMDFWNEYNIKEVAISQIRNLYATHNGFNKNFWDALTNKLETDQIFKLNITLLFGLVGKVKIKMKCFTEVRDNQKINPKHTGRFGEYGVLMKDDWLLKNEGCPVIYVNNSMILTNIIGKNLCIMKTLDNLVKGIKGIKGLTTHSSFFDLISFVETSKNRFEYEWRVISGHNLGGKPFAKKIDRLKFSLADVKSFYVPNKDAKKKTLEFLKKIEPDKAKIPQIYLTKEIVLTSKEIEKIEKINSM